MAEVSKQPSDGLVLQDSVVAGDLHVGDVIHHHHHTATHPTPVPQVPRVAKPVAAAATGVGAYPTPSSSPVGFGAHRALPSTPIPRLAKPVAASVRGAAAYPTPSSSPVGFGGHRALRPGERDLTEAYILCFFLGWFGGHRFYLGQPALGVLYFLTFGVFGLGWLADMIRMPQMVDRYNLERLSA